METPTGLVRILERDPDPDVALLGVDEVIDLLETARSLAFLNEQGRQLLIEALGVANV